MTPGASSSSWREISVTTVDSIETSMQILVRLSCNGKVTLHHVRGSLAHRIFCVFVLFSFLFLFLWCLMPKLFWFFGGFVVALNRLQRTFGQRWKSRSDSARRHRPFGRGKKYMPASDSFRVRCAVAKASPKAHKLTREVKCAFYRALNCVRRRSTTVLGI
ncbi:uncharacterized protein BKA78DRAFT_327555 [Phyllosticta capitalensis]|uniref:uncharacterized protein n=1 Tax=Phyllosticta capitalensis TaxID=121624 RepID=UPI00312CD87D